MIFLTGCGLGLLIISMIRKAASVPISVVGRETVVREGWRYAAISRLSKPATAISSGIRSPAAISSARALGMLAGISGASSITKGSGGSSRFCRSNSAPLGCTVFSCFGMSIRICSPAVAGAGVGFASSAAWGAVTGLTIKTMVVWGFKRGCFSNEAGLGSSVMVHSNSNVKEPVHQGLWGIFEVFVDTIVICTLVALVILTSGVIDLETGAIVQGGGEGATLVATAFSTVFGSFGAKFVAVALFLFAFTTVLGWSHYGTKSIEYLGGEKAASVYKVIFVVIIITGSLLTSSLAWDISDTFNGLMMIPNLIGVLVLSPIVVRLTRNYVRREIHSEKIEPMLSAFPDIQAEQAARTDED